MRYFLDLGAIKQNFHFNKNANTDYKLRHQHGKQVKIFPYTTVRNVRNAHDFCNIGSELSRKITGVMIRDSYKQDEIIELIAQQVEIEPEAVATFKAFIADLVFAEGQLLVFHPLIFNYRFKEIGKESIDVKVAAMLFSILFERNLTQYTIEAYKEPPENVLHKLVLSSLPKLNEAKNVDSSKYMSIAPFVTKVFGEDFMFTVQNKKMFTSEFENILKYYYMFYVSQTAVKLNQFFEINLEQPEGIYFILEGEKLSKSRTCYQRGWEPFLKQKVESLFSHAICLELLNHHNLGDKTLSYGDIRENIKMMSNEEKDEFNQSLQQLIIEYKDHIQDVSTWDKLNDSDVYEDKSFNLIRDLYRAIEFQFLEQKKRTNMRKQYYEWYENFCKEHFLRRHGQLGYVLTITQEMLILITRLCMKDSKKIGIKRLFGEYERRGLYFDKESKEAVVFLFDKLNLLEKKSDSGDAQYVRAIL